MSGKAFGFGARGRVVFLVVILLCAAMAGAWAQQITRVAVLDLSRVLAAFPQDMAAIKNFEARKAEVQATVNARTAEIKELQAKKTAAEAAGDGMTAGNYDQDIAKKTADLKSYAAARQAELDLMAKALSSTGFLKRLNAQIAQVAEAEGYTLVLNTKPDQGSGVVLWNSAAVDITDKVIQAMNSGT